MTNRFGLGSPARRATALRGVARSYPIGLLSPRLLTGRPVGGSLIASGNPSLIEVITQLALTTNLKLCLDAGDALSYTSGQSWLDRSGGGFDFFRGADGSATASDPTFNGAAGGLSGNEYWTFDGGDWFTYDSANETWMKVLHRDNAVFTILAWVYIPGAAETALLGNLTGGAGTLFRYSSGDTLAILCRKAGATVVLSVATGALSLTAGWHFLALSLNEPGGNVSFFYKDGGYAQVAAANTFDAAYSSPDASDPAQVTQIGSFGNGDTPFPNNTRLAMEAIWQGTALTKANLDSIYAATKGRFGL